MLVLGIWRCRDRITDLCRLTVLVSHVSAGVLGVSYWVCRRLCPAPVLVCGRLFPAPVWVCRRLFPGSVLVCTALGLVFFWTYCLTLYVFPFCSLCLSAQQVMFSVLYRVHIFSWIPNPIMKDFPRQLALFSWMPSPITSISLPHL